MKKLFALLTLIALAALPGHSEAVVGKPAPAFTAKDIQGQTHKLDDYKGKIVVLEEYNLDCPFSHNHYQTGAMQELQKEMTDQGIVWLVVNSVNSESGSYREPAKAQKEFKEQHMHATAWLDDSSGAIGKAYGLKTTPHMIVIDAKGNVAYNGAIDDRPVPEGDPRKARNYVREAVAALKAGEPVKVAHTQSYGCAVKYAN